MSRIVPAFAALSALMLSGWLTPAEATRRNFPTSQGWSNPSATAVYDDWDFNECTSDYFYWGNPPLGRTHLGADSQGAGAFTTIRAMADGVIVRSESGWPGTAVGIVHHTSTGQAFLGVYGHLAGATTSGTVTRGQSIGTTEGTVTHLHLGVRPLTAAEAASYIANGAPDIRGQGDTSCPSSSYGYVDPIPWLAARAPGTATPVDPQATVSPTLGESSPLTTFNFSATGFTPNGAIRTTVYNPSGSAYGGAYTRDRTATSTGAFSGNVLWFWEAGDELGRYRAEFRDVASGEVATVHFTIAEEPVASTPRCTVDDAGGIQVAWSAATANGHPVSRYEVSGDLSTVWVDRGTSRTHSYANAPLGVPQRFRIRATNGAGTGAISSWSAPCTARTVPAMPDPVVAAVDGGQLDLQWTAPDNRGAAILEYDLVWENTATTAAASVSTADTHWDFAPPSPAEPYRFQVAARNDAGWGAYSAWSEPLTADPGPLLHMEPARAFEGNGGFATLQFPLRLSEPLGYDAKIEWESRGAVAVEGASTLPAGTTKTMLTVEVPDNTLDEPDRRVQVRIRGANVALGAAFAQGRVVDDDGPPTLVPGEGAALEGDSGTSILEVPVTLSEPSGHTVSVTWAPSGLEGAVPGDVLDQGGTLLFPPGVTTANAEVLVVGDRDEESDERVAIVFSNPRHVSLDGSTGIAWVLDDGDVAITVPGAPGRPTASSHNNAIAVSWSAASSDAAILGYDLQYGSTVIHNGPSRSRTVSFGQDGAARTFRARACNVAGCGAWSSWSTSVRPKTIQLSRGAAATWGYWYNTTVTGPAGWSTTVRCNDGADLDFWSQAITLPSSGTWTDTTLCYSGDLNPYWVSAGSLESNRVSW